VQIALFPYDSEIAHVTMFWTCDRSAVLSKARGAERILMGDADIIELEEVIVR
jgi:hypothetical protein